MILGVGTDIVEIDRIRQAFLRNPKFGEKVYTEAERQYCTGFSDSAPRFAARFAAKEAVAKALGTGIGQVGWRDIEITNQPSGAPSVALHGVARQRQESGEFSHIFLSMSHTEAYATAYVVIER